MAFVANLEDPVLSLTDRHHFERVLRLRRGDPLTVADGRGAWRPCRFGPRLEPTGEVMELHAAEPPITLCFALIKGERPELVVQMLTELGVDRVVPFSSARSVVRWDPQRAARQGERLRGVARAAAAQCHRPRLPEVADVSTFAEVAALPGAARCERRGGPPRLDTPVLIVGPEGGWTQAEREAAPLPAVGLGDNILRAETAAVVAGAMLVALRSGTLAPGNGLPRRS